MIKAIALVIDELIIKPLEIIRDIEIEYATSDFYSLSLS